MITKPIIALLDKIQSMNYGEMDNDKFKRVYAYMFASSVGGLALATAGILLGWNFFIAVGLIATILPQIFDMVLNYFTFLPEEEEGE